MRDLAQSFLACLLVLAATCSCGETPVAPVAQDASEIEPRPVLQVGNSAPILAVSWINGSDNIVAIDSLGGIVLWDVANKLVLDHAQVPQINEYLQFWEVRPQQDPHRLSLVYAIDEPHLDLHITHEQLCPRAALHDGPWCTFTFDLDKREVIPDASIDAPDRRSWLELGDRPPGFPLSPDGTWRPEARRTVEVPRQDALAADPDVAFQHIVEEGYYPGLDCASSQRCDYMLILHPASGQEEEVHLRGGERLYASDIKLSADGTQLAQVYTLRVWPASRSIVEALDLTNGARFMRWAEQGSGEYRGTTFVDNGRLLLLGRGHNRYAGDLYEGVLPSSALRGIDGAWAAQEDEFAALDRRPIAPARVIDRDCQAGYVCPVAASYYAMELLNEQGDYIGAGNLADCVVELGEFYCDGRPSIMADGISRYTSATDSWERMDNRILTEEMLNAPPRSAGTWQRMEQPDWGDEQIVAMRLSPGRDRLAVLTAEGDAEEEGGRRTLRLRLFTIDGNRLVAVGEPLFQHSYTMGQDYGYFFIDQGNAITAEELLEFTPDGGSVIVSHFLHNDLATSDTGYEMIVAKTDGSTPARRFAGHSRTLVPMTGHRVFEVEAGTIADLRTGERITAVRDKSTLLSAGWIASGNLLWGAGTDGRVQFWDGTTGSLELTMYLLPDNGFFAMTPGGRYDTNMGADSSAVRWTVSDDSWRSLAPQTFMRDFYEPGLLSKLLACRAADNCDSAFRRLPAFDRINRVLPTVKIVKVEEGADAREAKVTIEVREGTGADGQPEGGMYNLRLFRNGRLVAMTPDRPERPQSSAHSWQDNLGRWQEDNRLEADAGVYLHTFTVPLPRMDNDPGLQVFSAYAFNETRIKSETDEFPILDWNYPYRFTPPEGWYVPHAYIINIGINAYDLPQFRLNYAAADAQLLGRRLTEGDGDNRSLPGYEIRQLTVVADGEAGDSLTTRITRETILNLLRLVGGQGNREEILATLGRQGIDASILQEATPSDLLIVSFSGHGWADTLGNFHLVPASGDTSDPDSLVSATDLSYVLRTNQAGEIALILDACFSSAIVESGGFRPGPMGDTGLGQLAYDKGILILAASQADSLAIENPQLRHGLLTYALAGPDEGLDRRDGPDIYYNYQLYLEDWLLYAVNRLPELSDVRGLGRYNPGTRSMESIRGGQARVPEGYIQRPSFFNFNSRPSRIQLRYEYRPELLRAARGEP